MIRAVLAITLLCIPGQGTAQIRTSGARDALSRQITGSGSALSRVRAGHGSLILSGIPALHGMSWSAGNPAALPWEAGTGWRGILGTVRSTSGQYRRPLDPEQERRTSATAAAWGPIGANRAGTGSVDIGRVLLQPGSEALSIRPYAGSPFIIADAEQPPLRQIDATLEGSLGVRLGDWGVGIGLGYTAADRRTQAYPVVRLVRDIGFAGVAGLTRQLSNGMLVGLHGTANAGRETLIVTAQTATTEVRPLTGFGEPDVIAIVQPGFFYRRLVGNGFSGTASLAGAGSRWVLFAGASRSAERGTSVRLAHPDDPHDRWSVRGIHAGAATGLNLLGGTLTATADWNRVSGKAFLPGIDEQVYVSSDSRIWLVATWRSAAMGPWHAAGTAQLTRLHEDHHDRLAEARSDLVLWTPGGSLTVARRLNHRFAAEFTWGIAALRSTGSIPDIQTFGTIAREIIGNTLLHDSRSAIAQQAGASFRWRLARTDMLLTASYAWTAPGKARGVSVGVPDGSRSVTVVQLSIRPR